MIDLTEIEKNGEFAKCICDYIYANKCERIIETGLYHGNGSTRIIASLIRGIPLPETEFYSIECSKESIEIAKKNLEADGFIDYVEILSGLSIPQSMLPSQEEIKNIIRRAKEYGSVKLDHEQDPDNGHIYYSNETYSFEEDDLIGKLLNRLNGQVDFILLDSGGHIGNIEFKYVLSLLKFPCAIALDDTRHIKHYRSREMILGDTRFEVLNDNEEKFGSMLVKFHPR